MGLESSTYIGGLMTPWPTSGEPKSQGDDHIRLIKTVLVNTFPNATVPYRFPVATVASTPQTILITDQNETYMISTASGDIACTLPTLTSGDTGWTVEVVKTSADANAVVVSPPSGNITSRVGNTASIRVGQVAEPAKFMWSGSAWYCFKPGLPIGTVISFDGTNVPYGFLTTDGAAVPGQYLELIAAVGGTLKDRKGRVDAGVDAASLRLSITHFGATPTLGAVGGLESHLNTSAQSGVASHDHAVFVRDTGHLHTMANVGYRQAGGSGINFYTIFGPDGYTPLLIDTSPVIKSANAAIVVSTTNGGASADKTATPTTANAASAHNNTQPTLIVHRIIRAC